MNFHRFFFLTALLGLTGCAGYRLGSQLPQDIQTVHVFIANNTTDEPLLETEVTQAVLRQLQRDGSLRLAAEDLADAHMSLDVTGFRLEPLSFDRQNRALPDEYRLVIEAHTSLVRVRDGAVLVRSGTQRGISTFPFQEDLTVSRRTATPRAADDLAARLVASVTEAWID